MGSHAGGRPLDSASRTAPRRLSLVKVVAKNDQTKERRNEDVVGAEGCPVEGELQSQGQLGATGVEDPPGELVIPKPSVANTVASGVAQGEPHWDARQLSVVQFDPSREAKDIGPYVGGVGTDRAVGVTDVAEEPQAASDGPGNGEGRAQRRVRGALNWCHDASCLEAPDNRLEDVEADRRAKARVEQESKANGGRWPEAERRSGSVSRHSVEPDPRRRGPVDSAVDNAVVLVPQGPPIGDPPLTGEDLGVGGQLVIREVDGVPVQVEAWTVGSTVAEACF